MNPIKRIKTALVLGGNGLIGNTIAAALRREKYDVIIVDRSLTHASTSSQSDHMKVDALKNEVVTNILYECQPDLVINCINIATIYSHNQRKGYPRIIRFYSDLYRGLAQIKHPVHYVQVGTTGSGGLGFNIPFTHGEKAEDLPIIHKAAFSGITTAMLTLLSRSFNGTHTISEVKPGLAVFKDEIVKDTFNKSRLVVLDGGESGYYTYNELRMLTSFMGFTTAQHIANKVMGIVDYKQIRKVVSQFDIIESLNRTIIMPTEEDLEMRDALLESMGKASSSRYIIATGDLGPPSLTRDLVLSYIHIANHPENKDAFMSCLSESQSVSDTLSYIARRHKGLYRYLKSQCTYENYLAMNPYVQKAAEPWEIVAKQFEL